MRLSPPSRRSGSSAHPAERGYILITLILFVALLAIALTALAPVITQQIKRDREEELIHRGTQYSRAIKHYMKKFSRYPTRIEDLENTNNVRFLRKRYKDPITGKDFKLLHQGEVQMSVRSRDCRSKLGGQPRRRGCGCRQRRRHHALRRQRRLWR